MASQDTTTQSAGTALQQRLGQAPAPESLDPDERMSVDELRALQFARLRWTL